jgi:hypothetical protein
MHRSIDLVDKWLENDGTDPTLRKCLIEYAHGRGGKTMSEIVGYGGEERCRPWRRLNGFDWLEEVYGGHDFERDSGSPK